MKKATKSHTRRAQVKTRPTPTNPRFEDTSWTTIVALLGREMDGFEHSMCFRHTTAIEDTPETLALHVDAPQDLSRISRKHRTLLYDTLDRVGRTRTIVRVRANIALRGEEPDYIHRTLPRPGGPAVRNLAIEESASSFE